MGVLNFKLIDSKMEGSISFDTAKTATANASVDKFFSDSRGFAKLIYYTGDSHQEIFRKATH